MTIKSKKAIAYIEQHTADVDIIYPLTNDQVAEVISLAETEAHKRAVEAHRRCCPSVIYNQETGELNRCIEHFRDGSRLCDSDCRFMFNFINELNK